MSGRNSCGLPPDSSRWSGDAHADHLPCTADTGARWERIGRRRDRSLRAGCPSGCRPSVSLPALWLCGRPRLHRLDVAELFRNLGIERRSNAEIARPARDFAREILQVHAIRARIIARIRARVARDGEWQRLGIRLHRVVPRRCRLRRCCRVRVQERAHIVIAQHALLLW